MGVPTLPHTFGPARWRSNLASRRSLPWFFLWSTASLVAAADPPAPWMRHTIDRSSRGADGVRLADANHDGTLDVVTGWEEGGLVRVCFQPGAVHLRQPWPAVTVGTAVSVEDAVLVDVDGDGALDVVSSCEGKNKVIQVHWGPRDSSAYLDPMRWVTEPIPDSKNKMMWMFTLPLDVDGSSGVDLVAGGKGPGAQLGWWQIPKQPRQLADWTWHALRPMGWTMSLAASDMDGDGDQDIVFTDRKGAHTGCFWLEHPDPARVLDSQAWKEHVIGGADAQVMFLTMADLDRDGLEDVLVAVQPKTILYCRRLNREGTAWQPQSLPFPPNTGNAKAVAAGDMDLDGLLDLVVSCESATPPKSGIVWLAHPRDGASQTWISHDISGPEGVKYDLIQLWDLDRDGDLDVMACEEQQNLGVFWHENPRRLGHSKD